ncbi:MAG: hypothetical protein JW904_02540 [Spirochaetales bacterium]|nr:hypothetical protein [Spirochaetales bacterium]
MNNKTTPIIIIGIIGFVILTYFLSPAGPGSCDNKITITELPPEERQNGVQFITDHFKAPEEFIGEQFDSHDIIFLGEFGMPNYTVFGFRENVSLVKKVIPILLKKGIYLLAIEHLLAEDQEEIDKITSAREFDEPGAKRLISRRAPLFLFQDYVDLIRDVWTVNRGKSAGDPLFRIIGLNMKLNYVTLLQAQEAKELGKAFDGMVQEDFIFSVIDREIIGKKKKALVFVNMLYAIKKDILADRHIFYKDMELDYSGSPAKLTIDKVGDRAMVMLQHNLWVRNDQTLGFPIEGYFDALLRELPGRVQETAFFVKGSPFENLTITTAFIMPGTKPVFFSDICDAYILQGQLNYYTVPQMFTDTINEENMGQIKAMLQLPDEKSKTLEDITAEVRNLETVNSFMSSLPK